MEPDRRIRRIAIVGGGIAGWTAAAMLGTQARRTMFNPRDRDARARDPRARPKPTQPHLLELLRFLGVDQNDFIDKTQSTYSLGTRFHRLGGAGPAFLASVRRARRADRAPAVLSLLAQGARRWGCTPKLEYFSQEVVDGDRPIASSSRPTRWASRSTCVMRCTSTPALAARYLRTDRRTRRRRSASSAR